VSDFLLRGLFEAAYYCRPWFVQEMPVTSAITRPANNTAVQPGKILEVSGKIWYLLDFKYWLHFREKFRRLDKKGRL
jgi:hypothetical protein